MKKAALCWNKSEVFYFIKKNAVEMFVAYMQKAFFFFFKVMFLFWASLQRKFQLQKLWSCALAW